MAAHVGSKISSAAQRAADNGAEFYERARDRAQSAIESGREGFEAAARHGRRQAESLAGVVREWPLLSVATAFAIGCLASRLLRR